VCSGGQCWTRYYETYECWNTGGGGTGDPGGGPGGGGNPAYNPYDSDGNGAIDVWRGVVATDDDCANNFDENDRLGSEHGGTNTVRPGHNGVDIQADYGDAVYAAFDGTVENVGTSGGCGYRVQVRNSNGTHTTYCHMVDLSSPLAVGSVVRAGLSQLGQADSTGTSSGDHLHITHLDANFNNAGEYFSSVDQQPSPDQLNNGGC
jgi:murein DD-endopeptidase MepM/ murein hydrolase activator NlpD